MSTLFTASTALIATVALMLCTQAAQASPDDEFNRAAAPKPDHLIQPDHGTASQLRARRMRARHGGSTASAKPPTFKNYPAFPASVNDSVSHARQLAMTTLNDQLGKPYLWGGSSPGAGFDCSGLVYYAYRDLLDIQLPRTANTMYHLKDAPRVGRHELERGDLVFFAIHTRQAADHVGVYLGEGRFIQAPRTGKTIRVSSLHNDYWTRHYLGARRLLTQATVR
ncbi:cell wall-associated NlpC family hydrolase [Kushneria sinocarnis]|uniref:Cell wall-associated NlpC family hydrolase n=1 Tax=Kushneria sinocarnis TaxID=595502 RepID=A0A420WSK4_9GAMM|nr:C40 family peptidase [Kushneria sinocarnis]RKQ95712.1 cell wall-associated NlpC family hydrolase [Kushneria sinocarnis]